MDFALDHCSLLSNNILANFFLYLRTLLYLIWPLWKNIWLHYYLHEIFLSLTISCLENYDGKECDNVMMIKLGKS